MSELTETYTSKVEWKPIPGTDYFISSLGEIGSSKRSKGGFRVLKPFLDRRGKPVVELFLKDGKKRQTRIGELLYRIHGIGEKPKTRKRKLDIS